jgi:hypothetical protein
MLRVTVLFDFIFTRPSVFITPALMYSHTDAVMPHLNDMFRPQVYIHVPLIFSCSRELLHVLATRIV